MDDGWRPKRTLGKLARRKLAEMERNRKRQIPQQGNDAYRGVCPHCRHTYVVCHPLDKNEAATERMPPLVGDLLECDACECQMRVAQVIDHTVKATKHWIPGGMEA